MNDFGKTKFEMPYRVPEAQFDALHERIRRATADRRPAPRRRVLLVAAGTLAGAAALLGIGLFATVRRTAPAPDLEQLLSTAPAEVVQQAAAANYDDILYIQQL